MVSTQAGVDLESFEYDRALETYRSRYDDQTMAPSMAVVATLSKVNESCPMEVSPLGNDIDTDALDQFLESHESTTSDASVTFTTQDRTVTVYDSGEIAVSPEEAGLPDGSTADSDTS